MVLLAEAPSLPEWWAELHYAGDLVLSRVMWLQGPPWGHAQQDGTGWPWRCWVNAWHHGELQLPQHGCGPECGSPGHTTAPHGCHLGERWETGETGSPEIMEKTNALSLLGFFCVSFQCDRIWMSPHHPRLLLKSFAHASPFPPGLVSPLCSYDTKTYFISAQFSDLQKALSLHKYLQLGLKIMRINNFIPKALPLLMDSERTVLYI